MSIDVALGASSCSSIFFVLTGQKIVIPSLVSIFVVVWLIYTLDHLMDAKKIKIPAILPRHRFHQQHFNKILSVWIIVGLFSIFIISQTLYPLTLYSGIILFFAVGLHFILIRFLGFKVSVFIQKELGIAIIYTLGIAIPALSRAFLALNSPILLSLVSIFLLAIANLLEFSYFEVNEDKIEEQTSIVRVWGQKRIEKIILAVILLNYLITSYILINSRSLEWIGIGSCFIIMNSVLLLIIRKKELFKSEEKYRLWGDGIFIIPGVFTLIYEILN